MVKILTYLFLCVFTLISILVSLTYISVRRDKMQIEKEKYMKDQEEYKHDILPENIVTNDNAFELIC